MDMILSFMPYWGWLAIGGVAALIALRLFGFNAAILALVVGAVVAVYAKGRKAGVAVEAERQHRADDVAREIIHERKEDVRSIPNTPAGDAERNSRFDRWL